jgi:uncharacterized protein (DUF1501 family)
MGRQMRRSSKQRFSSVTRRDFLRVGGLSVVGLSVAERAVLASARGRTAQRSCILLLMTGGASQLDTFDPKPAAPAEIRGPSRAIPTSIPGVQFSEALPLLARRANRFAVLRSLHHDAAPIHETGLQLLQTGRLARNGVRYPAFGSVIARAFGPRNGLPPYVVLPRQLTNTGVNVYRGQEAGLLGTEFDAHAAELENFTPAEEPEAVRRAYGETRFGRLCLRARQLVEAGVRCVTVNLFDSLAGQPTWDCHARGPASPGTLYDYRDTLGPQFDRACSALLDDLHDRGLLSDTLVVAAGEFGRTPRINEFGGRDHWTGVWSALVAGAGVRGGQVIGASDREGAVPVERPIAVPELTATLYHALGLEPDVPLTSEGDDEIPIVNAAPIRELFA